MNGRNTKLGGLLGLTLASALGIAGCEDTDGGGDGGLLDDIKKQCGLTCPAKGIVDGNASISGYAPIDDFFGSVVKFQTVSASVAASIDADIKDIQAGFRITPAELQTAGMGGINAAIRAKVTAAVEGSLVVNAEPARCDIDARASFEAKARCEASAGCNVMATPPMVNVECSGSCEAEASVMASCSAGATISCTVRDPSFMCTGQCSGECTVNAMAAAACSGTCRGTCSGGCSAAGDANGDGVTAAGECVGSCSGMCTGSCTADASVTAMCNGSCSGECTYTPPSAMCQANATVRCQAQANAKIMCQGKCDGEVTPPMVNADCNAEASCEASAKADASLSVQCTPPSVNIDYRLKAGANATVAADVRSGINTLRAKWPSLLTSLKKGDLVIKAGTSLAGDANFAVMETVNAVANGGLDVVASYRVGACVPSQVPRVGEVITKASTGLTAQVSAATQLRGALGMM